MAGAGFRGDREPRRRRGLRIATLRQGGWHWVKVQFLLTLGVETRVPGARLGVKVGLQIMEAV